MCVVPVHAARVPVHHQCLTRLRLDGILLCEAHGRCRDRGITHDQEACLTDETTTTGTAPKKVRGGRPRGRRIEVWVTPDEEASIADLAAQAGMSKSAYLRAVGLNQPVRSVLDLTAVADLAKVNGDLGRVAGLLKLWLAERRGEGARPVDVQAMMRDFRQLQGQVLELMGRVLRDR